MLSGLSEEHAADIWRARLTLALVSARTRDCPNRRCTRARHCLAAMGPNFNVNKPMGECPNMSAAEWGTVSLGMVRVANRLRHHFRQQNARWWAELDKLPKEERERRRKAEGWVPGLAQGEDPSYFQWLWLGEKGDDLGVPRDPVEANRWLIDNARKHGVMPICESGAAPQSP